jgi:membrane protease YdiL (CAAX protease family)
MRQVASDPRVEMDQNGRRGVRVYAMVVLAGSLALSTLLHSMGLSVGGRGSGALIFMAMWMPSLARLIATRTVDRGWRPPFPLRRWGRHWWAVLLVPLATVFAIYVGAYTLASVVNVPRAAPVWRGASLVLNVAVNLPLLAIAGVFGGLGEELGWRGYLQPRLDQLGVPAALFRVIALETAFHVPLILLAGYTAGESRAMSIALFFGLKLGATPVWTWATYRWRTIWMAVWFHAFHNALSQVLVPKSMGTGDPRILGESGVLPIALYLLVAGAMFGVAKMRELRAAI